MPKSNVAFIFPGQGSQFVGMGKDFFDEYSVAKDIYKLADTILNKNISDICFNGPEEDLKQTINTQPAIYTTSYAILKTLLSQVDIIPDYVAGHSLGEYVAMCAASVFSFETGLKLIQKRAEVMSEVSEGSMAAVINADNNQIENALKLASEHGYIDIANYNSPVQVVLTGNNNAIQIASEYLLNNGVKRVIPLAVSGAFHSEFMKDAGSEFEKYLANFKLSDAKIPVITNIDACTTLMAKDFKIKMPAQIYSSVHWTQTIEKMIQTGVNTFIEIGPGKVLAGLNRKINSDVKTYSVYNKDSLDLTVEKLKE